MARDLYKSEGSMVFALSPFTLLMTSETMLPEYLFSTSSLELRATSKDLDGMIMIRLGTFFFGY